MKKHLLILGLSGALVVSPVCAAVTKCVDLNSSSSCTVQKAQSGKIEWGLLCDGNVSVQGISACSSRSGTSMGTTSSDIPTVSYSSGNVNCYCRMISPAVSQWVYLSGYSNVDACMYNCASDCAYMTYNNASMRSALFRNLSD